MLEEEKEKDEMKRGEVRMESKERVKRRKESSQWILT